MRTSSAAMFPVFNPYADKRALSFFRDNESKFTSVVDILRREFGQQMIGAMLLAPEKGSRDEDARIVWELMVLTTDIVTGDIEKGIERRRQVIRQALAQNDLICIRIELLHLSGLWKSCSGQDPDLFRRLAKAVILADNQFLTTFVMAVHHKTRVIKKFTPYVLCYCFSGSTVRGLRRSSSDLDVFVVINDTDVKRMALSELKARLHSVIRKYGEKLAREFDIDVELNIQVYILTDYWESLKDANPVIYTLLRDGVPLFDTGVFSAWKELLRTGRIRPTDESVVACADLAESHIGSLDKRLTWLVMEETYWGVLSYAQASLMSLGFSPGTPSETVKEFESRFVKSDYSFPEEHFRTLKNVVTLRKKLEHGNRKTLTVDRLRSIVIDSKSAGKAFKHLVKDLTHGRKRSRLQGITKLMDEAVVQLAQSFVDHLGAESDAREIISVLKRLELNGESIDSLNRRTAALLGKAGSGKLPSLDKISQVEMAACKSIQSLKTFVEWQIAADSTLISSDTGTGKAIVALETGCAYVTILVGKESSVSYKLNLSVSGSLKGSSMIQAWEIPFHTYRKPAYSVEKAAILHGSIACWLSTRVDH